MGSNILNAVIDIIFFFFFFYINIYKEIVWNIKKKEILSGIFDKVLD